MQKVIEFLKKHLAACLILSTSLVLGCMTFGDYGIAWDEPLQREIGQKTYNYIFKGDKTLNNFKNRDYGVAVELPLIFLEQICLGHDTRDIYRMRHLTIHIFFLLSAFAFYLLIWILYRNRPLAVFGYLMLLLSPRIYAQSFFNSKDIPFMCMFIICFLVCAIAFRDKKLWHFVLFGIMSGLLINIRIMGIVIPAMITGLVLIDQGALPEKNLHPLLRVSCSDYCRGGSKLALVMGRSGGAFQDRFFKHVEIQVGQ
jgi:uncharacterized membrane protein YagU involved in acid resistance